MKLTFTMLLIFWLSAVGILASPLASPPSDIAHPASTNCGHSYAENTALTTTSTIFEPDSTAVMSLPPSIAKSGDAEIMNGICYGNCNVFGLLLRCLEPPASCTCDKLGVLNCATAEELCEENCKCQCDPSSNYGMDGPLEGKTIEKKEVDDAKEPEAIASVEDVNSEVTNPPNAIEADNADNFDNNDCHIQCNALAIIMRCLQGPTFCTCTDRGWVRCRVYSKFCFENCICQCESKRVAIDASKADTLAPLELAASADFTEGVSKANITEAAVKSGISKPNKRGVRQRLQQS